MFLDNHINDNEPIVFKRKVVNKQNRVVPIFLDEENLQTKTEIKSSLKKHISDIRIKRGYKTRKLLANAMNINVYVIECIETGNGNVSKSDINKVCQFLKTKQS